MTGSPKVHRLLVVDDDGSEHAELQDYLKHERLRAAAAGKIDLACQVALHSHLEIALLRAGSLQSEQSQAPVNFCIGSDIAWVI